MSTRKRVAIYARVSTLDQDTDMQVTELTKYAKSRGWEIVKVYEDKATGTNTNRKAFKEMVDDSRKRRFDILLVWKLDRIFRSLKDCLNGLTEFTDLGIEFVAFKDNGIDMTTPTGKLMMHLLAAFAEFEASMIKMRVISGIKAAREKGVKFGRPTRRPDEKIKSLREKKVSIREIAKQLGITASSVQRSLKTT